MKKIQAGDLSYEENSAAAATRARVEMDGVSAEKSHLTAKVGNTNSLQLTKLFLSSPFMNVQ